ncbi:MAG: cytochrome c [Pseudomonadota bacterium]
MVRYGILAGALAVMATTTLAHTGVKDAQVLARMEVMKRIGDATDALEDIATGRVAFDAGAVAAARASLLAAGGETIAVFTPPADDPKSEARRAIWDSFDRFEALTQDMIMATDALDPTDSAAFAAQYSKIEATCVACHKAYRAKR